jgi:uncharacterized repeat protein (TIGR03806 family)
MIEQWLVRTTHLIALASALCVCSTPTWASEKTPSGPAGKDEKRDVAIERNIPWRGSTIKGSPDPPDPYTAELAFPKLKFNNPLVLVPAPGTNRLFVGEQYGRIYSFPEDPNCAKADLVFDVSQLIPDFTAFYGLVFHPQFDRNRYVYLCYVGKNDLADGSVVSRFTVSRTDPPVIDPKSEVKLIKFYSGGHNGACLAFGNDGHLYISTGDGASPTPPDPMMTGQDCSDLLSSILRIDVDHTDPDKTYRVPADNPFVGMRGVRPEIWAYGFRNPWKMSFDKVTGRLWVGDVGWELWELVYDVKRGGNYGWSVMEGPQPVNVEARRGPTPISPPIKVHPHSEAASITGGYVYRGARLRELAGTYIYGDFQSGIVWGLRAEGDKITWERELARTAVHLVAFGESNSGEIYMLDYDRTHQIYRLARNAAGNTVSSFPRRMSQTGLFTSTAHQQPAPGVIPYRINAELWSDGATAERFVAVPERGQMTVDDRGIWRCPDGTVLVRTVSIEQEQGQPATRRRMETQILHLEADAWRPYSYVWNRDQTDATLAEPGGSSVTVGQTTAGEKRELNYRVFARTECVLCHSPWVEKRTTIYGIQSASPLGFITPQLNRTFDKGPNAPNQFESWHEMGALAWSPELDKLPKMVDPYDESADLDRRARSYLHTNCAHCHQFGSGGSANIELKYDLPLDNTKIIGQRPIQGAFNISGASIIAPGDPAGSVLYYRIAKLGGGRMPRVGSQQVDERAVRTIHDWIASLSATKPVTTAAANAKIAPEDRAAIESLRHSNQLSPGDRKSAINRLFTSTRGALMLLALIDKKNTPETLKRDVASITKDVPTVEVRDLFERFIPERERTTRLGDVVNRPSILALRGDSARGRLVFTANAAAQCKTCHKAGDIGENIGPDLTKIGAKYDKAALLDQILDPSKTVEPAYITHMVETKDGRIVTGLLVQRNNEAVVLKDAQGKNSRIPVAEIEQFAPQPRSLMPELLIRDLTAEQVADLLEFLASLR